MKKTKIIGSFFTVAATILSFAYLSCSLLGPGPGNGQTVELRLSIQVPSAASANANAAKGTINRAVFPQSTKLQVTISGDGLSSPVVKYFTKNGTNAFEVSISNIPTGKKTIDLVAGTDGSTADSVNGLTHGAAENVDIGFGTNNISIYLEPVESVLAGTVTLGTGPVLGIDPAPQLGVTRFYKLVPNPAEGSANIPAGAYVVRQNYEGFYPANQADFTHFKVYDYHGAELTGVVKNTITGDGDGAFEQYFGIGNADSPAYYVGVYLADNLDESYWADPKYDLLFNRGIFASIQTEDGGIQGQTDDMASLTFNFSAPVTVGNLNVQNKVGETWINISGASGVATNNGRSVTITPSAANGWTQGDYIPFNIQGLSDAGGNAVDLSSKTNLGLMVGRVFYVDPLNGLAAGVQTDSNSTVGRKATPFKYIDDLLGSYETTDWFNVSHNYRNTIKVAGYPYDGAASNPNVLSTGTSYINLHTAALSGIRIKGGLNPATWRHEADRYSYAGATGLPANIPLVDMDGLTGNVEFSGFILDRNGGGVSDLTIYTVKIEDCENVYLTDNIIFRASVVATTSDKTSSAVLIGSGGRTSILRNTIQGPLNTYVTEYSYNVKLYGVEFSSGGGGIIIANNTISPGNLIADGINASVTATSVGIAAGNVGTIGSLLIANNTIIAGRIESQNGGSAIIANRHAIDLSASTPGIYDGIAIVNNILSRSAGGSSLPNAAADSAIRFATGQLSYTHYLHNNVFADWTGSLLFSQNEASYDYAAIADVNNLGGVFATAPVASLSNGTAAMTTASPPGFLDSNYDFTDGFVGGTILTSGGFGVSSGTLSVSPSNTAISGFGLNLSSGYAVFNAIANPSSNLQYLDDGGLNQLVYDRQNKLRTANGDYGWTPGAFEKD